MNSTRAHFDVGELPGLAFRSAVAVLMVLALTAAGNARAAEPMYKDHKAVLIFGHAVGKDGGHSRVSVFINDVEFSVSNPPWIAATSEHTLGALDTCEQLREQVADFTLEMSAVPEFDAVCLALAGDAAMLVVQASPLKYEIPGDDEDEISRWTKEKRRYLHLRAYSNDEVQRVKVR